MTPPPQSKVAHRLAPFGETVFAEITRLAIQHDAINLGQGFPNFDGPASIMDAARQAMAAGHNQYARSSGVDPLVNAVAARINRRTDGEVDPLAHVTVTTGCTEAIAATCLGLINPGDEVILFEPFYDSYRACVAMSGGTPVFVPLEGSDFHIPLDRLEAAFSDRTRAILVNTPHNPTGRVFSESEMNAIAELCTRHDVIAITDEVYEDLVYDGTHRGLATLPGMWERTVTLSSLGKSFSLTGWKIGWAVAPEPLTAGVRSAHQFLTFATATPLQHAAAAALEMPETYYDELRADYRRKRDLLVDGLESVGFQVSIPASGFFAMADHTALSDGADDVTFARRLIADVGVAAIPPSAFYEHPEKGRDWIRFAFCKDDDTIKAAVDRLRQGLGR